MRRAASNSAISHGSMANAVNEAASTIYSAELLDCTPTGSTPTVGDVDNLSGSILNGTYAVEQLLGEGGMGRVYLARHSRISQKQVAIKVLRAEFASSADALARFQREAEAAACISHPNVVAVLDVDRAKGGQPYLVCEYLHGIDLSEHLKKLGKLDVTTAIHVARQLCQGLGAAHARGVIHRDLKPQNVFLLSDSEGRIPALPTVKVVDFGLSKVLDAEDAGLTKTGIIMGTPAFMSPEQAQAKSVDHRTDVYGVGAILYKALTGSAPFERESPHATVLAVMSGEPQRPRAVEPSIPEHVEIMIQRAMARNPGERFPDMLAFDRALEQLEHESRSTESSAPLRAMIPTSTGLLGDDIEDVRRTRLRLVGLLFLVIALVLASGAVAITGVEQAAGVSLGRLELGLLLLAVFGSSFTPAVLWIRSIRRNVWENSSKVLFLLGQLRAALVTAVSVFGLGTLALHLVDDVLVRFIYHPQLTPVRAAWPGWNPLLALVAMILAVTVVVRRRLLLPKPRPFVRTLAAWAVSGAALLVAVAVIYAGLLLGGRLDRRTRPAAAGTTPNAAQQSRQGG